MERRKSSLEDDEGNLIISESVVGISDEENSVLIEDNILSTFHKKKSPLKENYNFMNTTCNPIETTPTKSKIPSEPALTPTANLKLLTNLASMEYKTNLSITEDDESLEMFPNSRKEKSLGRLCSRFIDRYPAYPTGDNVIEISLDAAAVDLGVGRRRIYDIVNVLESVHIVKKSAKNCYIWQGKVDLPVTLARLKMLAESEKMSEKFDLSKRKPVGEELAAKGDSSANTSLSSRSSAEIEINRRENSLGAMSQKFLMLFLISKNQNVYLDLAAEVLIGETTDDKTSTTYKTKVRRLYDIANIFTSLQLITKATPTGRGRTLAYRFIGPTPANISRNEWENFPLYKKDTLVIAAKRPLNSSLSQVKKQKFSRTRSESVLLESSSRSNSTSTFGRHQSLHLTCHKDINTSEAGTVTIPNENCQVLLDVSRVLQENPTSNQLLLLSTSGEQIEVINFTLQRSAPSSSSAASTSDNVNILTIKQQGDQIQTHRVVRDS
ncbi:hypothetical protein CHUAL_005377 [Chamberlinius hualienensis]